jgi:hypothetical protein
MSESWQAASKRDLGALLRQVDVDVPIRTGGREHRHTERWAIARLLSSIREELLYPLSLSHEDRPDFVLTMAGARIGIEHSEVASGNVNAAQAIRERGLGPEVYWTPRATFDEPQRTFAQLKAEIDADEFPQPSYGDSPERNTASALAGFARRKAKSALKDGYQLEPKNWLLLYNNWPGINVDVLMACKIARKEMLADGVHGIFERVWVLGSTTLVTISQLSVTAIPLVEPH